MLNKNKKETKTLMALIALAYCQLPRSLANRSALASVGSQAPLFECKGLPVQKRRMRSRQRGCPPFL